ncbi:MAG: amino acid permease [Candidatus Omnitrophota bacterium]
MKLNKDLNFLSVFCVATGAMISSGLFVLPGLAHAQAGPAVVLSYLFAGILAVTGMLSQAELISAMPKAGGTYFHVTRSMGPAAGTVDGLLTWFSLSLKSAFALIGMAAFAAFIGGVNIRFVAAVLCLFFTLVNILGVKGAGRLQVALVVVLWTALSFYVLRGLPAVDWDNFRPFFAAGGMAAVFSTAGLVFVSYGGLLKVSSIAEEVKDPARVIPLAMIFSLLTVTLLYIVVVFVASGVLGAGQLDNSLTPISEAAFVFLGPGGRAILSIAAILAFVSTANAGIMAASRYPLALSRDDLLPKFIGRINNRFRTPHIAIIFTGALIIIALFLRLEILVKFASGALILTFILSCLSVIILRESRLQNYRPCFRSPFYPGIQLAGIAGFGFLLVEMGRGVLLVAALVVSVGLFVYWFYGRIRVSREFALLHLIERITAKELTTHSLETELKEIIRERDDIVKDRFDHIIEDSAVLDIEEAITMEDFFRRAAGELAQKLAMDKDVLFDLLLRREKDGTTVLNPELAIPHIVIPGSAKFTILLARCRQGIKFSQGSPKVKIVFVLAGTKDERNFHLRALSAIAQIVQDAHFEKSWLAAKTGEVLRDIVLLGERRRHS